MDFDTAKENIQPLASGRNAEQLETALIAESDQETQEKLNEQRREYERAIATYEGDDPLQPWYDYVVWVEQIYPKSGKESAMHEILAKCLAMFEKDERYFQDRRMLKLYIKYIDSEPNPPQFYEQLYNNGIGTMIADLYVCWAHYYDYCDNYEKAEAVYRKGLDARAQPIELIEQAHRQFGFSMSQRLLYKDESTRKEFRSTMDEQRLALTSLRAHKHRHVGSIRTGSAVKSVNPGRLDQSSTTGSRRSNRKIQVFEDAGAVGGAPTSPTAESTSVVQSILNSTKKQENMREPGPWNKAKIKSHALFSGASSSKPSFSILQDDDFAPIPLPDSENNYARGIQLPKDFIRRNLPQEEFSFPLHRDDEPQRKTLYAYNKFMLFPAPDKCFSMEELQAYKWFKKRNIANNFTRTQDAIWENGYDVPIRLPPHFVRKNASQDKFEWSPCPFDVNEVLANGQRKFGFDINLIYTPGGEFSPEEILQSKWLNGDLMCQKEAEMELTCGFERREDIYVRNAKRRSMALGGRKSILPRKSNSPRKSIARKSIAPSAESLPSLPVQQDEEPTTSAAASTGAIKRTSLPKRKSVYMTRMLDSLSTIPETASPPASRRKYNEDVEMAENQSKPDPSKFSIFEDADKEAESENVFKVPQSAPVASKTRVSSVFQDEDFEGCTTQTFNFFIKSQSISTPKVVKQTKMLEPETAAAMRKGLDFGSDDGNETSPAVADSDQGEGDREAFASRGTDTDFDAAYLPLEPHEIYRQKLSAIMETTEECATVSSLAATASSKSSATGSSAEDFDFTKHTNHQLSAAMSTYRHQTIVNNTAKMSASTVSVTGRENESKKFSALGFEIYQEEPPKSNETMANSTQPPANVSTSHGQVNTSKKMNSSRQQKIEADEFEKTLPPAGQFHIYEDEEKTAAIEAQVIANAKKESSMLGKEVANKSTLKNGKEDAQQSVFEISQEETAPSDWHWKREQNANRVSVISKSRIDPNFTLTMPENKPQNQTGFHGPRENTDVPAPNFAEERTEQMPPSFLMAQNVNLTQQPPPAFDNEAPSIYMPEIPDDDENATRNLSRMFAASTSKMDASARKEAPRVESQSRADQSVFVFATRDDTTNAFTANYTEKFLEQRTETIQKLPNLMQMSMFDAGHISAYPMIPEMPTLPNIDLDATKYENMNNQSQAAYQSMRETTLKANNKTIAEQSVFGGFSEDTDLISNKSGAVGNKLVASQQGSTESDDGEITSNKTLEPNNQNKSVFVFQDGNAEREYQQTTNVAAASFTANKSMAESNKSQTNVGNELYAMSVSPAKPVSNQDHGQSSPSPVADKTSFLLKSFSVEKFDKSKATIDDELYAMINPSRKSQMEANNVNFDANKSLHSKTIDDELYAMIKSPVGKTDKTLLQGMLIVDTPPPPSPPPPITKSILESIVSERKTVHQISLFKDPSMSLLEPMKRTSVRESVSSLVNIPQNDQRNSSVEAPKTLFSDDNPNTAMFSLHMPSIKNSTILVNSKEHINNITDELKTSLVLDKEKSMANIPETSLTQNQFVSPSNLSAKLPASDTVTADSTIAYLKVNSIHIKEEPPSFRNKTAVAEKSQKNIDDELYACIKESEKQADVNGFLDLSIELTSAEMENIGPTPDATPKPVQNYASNFVIGNPVSIRPSQFPMNETQLNQTTTKDEVQQMEKSLKEIKLEASNRNDDAAAEKHVDDSLIIVEDTEDLASACKAVSAINKTRRDTMHSPFKNHYATNPRLNETISAVKEIEPFDIHLQNAFLDDIDFIEYIRSLENVNIMHRVRPIELNSELEMGTETFTILKQIGQGSFGYVYSGKSTKTGKMYAFKQERPANLWEFYISLEIATRIEDPKMLPGFMSVDYASVGHNSSIFASELCEYGSLFEISNRHKLNTCRNIDEVIAMVFSEQMLSILDHLHASNIIHGDLKPDNFLLMRKLSYGSNELVIKLIDYGRSIDLNFFPPKQTFTSTLNTKNFVCTEMLENKPWKHQIDLFCLASTMHALICGKYMNIKKHPDSKLRPYVLSEELPTYLDVPLWEHVLYSLINVRDHNALPDLQKLRLLIREAIVDKEHILQDRISKFNAVLDV